MFFPLLGFSVNTLSMFGLVLAIGIVVDDAIVVVEAVMHHIEKGMAPRDATIQAMKEVSGPVTGIALILSAVFIPVAFIPGLTGQMYQQFALTIAISVLLSAFAALSLAPALAAMILKPHQPVRGPIGKFFAGFNNALRTLDERLHPWRAIPGAPFDPHDRHCRGRRRRRRLFRRGTAGRLHSGGRPEPARHQCHAAARRLARAHQRGARAGREDRRRHGGRRVVPDHRRLRRCHQHLPAELRDDLRAPEAVGRTRG